MAITVNNVSDKIYSEEWNIFYV